MARIFSIVCCFTVVAGIFVSAIANKYCKIKCEDPFEEGVMYEHTMCTYPSPNPAPACVKSRSVGLNDAERKAIVQKHNELRRQVASGKERRGKPGPQPPAVNMPDLTWDTELETIAQRWVNQCISDHDKCRNVERFYVGQNMASRDTSGENDTSLEYLIQKWYDEVKNFDRRLVSNFQDTEEITGHYTQMVWAETKKIGCGRIKYNIKSNKIRHFLVCNYGPGGNMLDEPVYKIKK